MGRAASSLNVLPNTSLQSFDVLSVSFLSPMLFTLTDRLQLHLLWSFTLPALPGNLSLLNAIPYFSRDCLGALIFDRSSQNIYSSKDFSLSAWVLLVPLSSVLKYSLLWRGQGSKDPEIPQNLQGCLILAIKCLVITESAYWRMMQTLPLESEQGQ